MCDVEDSQMSIDSVTSPMKMDPETDRKLSWAEEVILSKYGQDQLNEVNEVFSSAIKQEAKSDERNVGSSERTTKVSRDLNKQIGGKSVIKEIKDEITVKEEIKKESSPNREIVIDFLDRVNEQKFERLINEEKINPPYKRRHSGSGPIPDDSRSNSPTSNSNQNNQKNNRENNDKSTQQKRVRRSSYSSSTSSNGRYETDPAILSRRQKQIDYGKNTVAYDRYCQLVPKDTRSDEHPKTPKIHFKYSRRAFDGLVRLWRKQLHYYEPPAATSAIKKEEHVDSDDEDIALSDNDSD